MLNGYDIIGDIHGHAEKLKALLAKLGYAEHGGAWKHPERMVIFLGDYIDRGKTIKETLAIVSRMREAGSAMCLMGNHEFNAICWATPDPDHPDEFLRKHVPAKKKQHEATLEQLAGCYSDWIAWMRTLPVWLDVDDLGGNGGRLHLIHACWSPERMDALRRGGKDGRQWLAGESVAPCLTEACYVQASRKNTPEYKAIEDLLKGPEMDLPEGVTLHDKDGSPRRTMRVKWWAGMADTCREMALMGLRDLQSIPESARPGPLAWQAIPVQHPTLFGHYWRSPDEPMTVYTSKLACLDFSAGNEGPLVAYRWNRGDTVLSNDRFVGVGR